jgi:iron(III) transport system substrate-binding protein
MVKKAALILSILVALSPVMMFAGGQQEAAAPEEVVVYASVDEANAKKILDVFTEDTGIKVAFVHLSSGPAFSRIQAEANNPQADVWLGAPSENHIVAKEEGLTVSYKSDEFEKLGDQFKDPDGYWRSFYMNPMAFGVNTEALEKAGAPMPTSWADLTKPAYEGLIQAPTPQASGTAYNIVASLVTMMGEDEAFAYMADLSSNIQTYTSSGTGPSKAVAVGQCAIGIQFTPAFFQFISEGYPLEVVFPKEGVGFEAPAVSIIEGAQNMEAAKILIDWLVSKDGQDVLSEQQTFFYPVNSEAQLAEGMPAFESLKTVSFDVEWAGLNKERLVERWVNEVLTAK